MSEDNLSKAELALIDRIVGAVGLAKFRNTLWGKVQQAFRFSFHGTNIEYGFARATPDERALVYLEDRIFILSDKTQAKLVGDLRWELLEGMKNAESIDVIKRRLDGIFEENTVNTGRIARTEVLNAMNAGRQSAYEESGVVHYKMWKAAMRNARTAADSKRLNGQIQEVDNPFVDPKTGDSFMHPPNRPNCRCAMIPLRKLPENVVHKGGQMYAADEMVGKIEIDIGSLQKDEKRIWVKPTSKRKGHYRKIKGAKKVIQEGQTIISTKDKGEVMFVTAAESIAPKVFDPESMRPEMGRFYDYYKEEYDIAKKFDYIHDEATPVSSKDTNPFSDPKTQDWFNEINNWTYSADTNVKNRIIDIKAEIAAGGEPEYCYDYIRTRAQSQAVFENLYGDQLDKDGKLTVYRGTEYWRDRIPNGGEGKISVRDLDSWSLHRGVPREFIEYGGAIFSTKIGADDVEWISNVGPTADELVEGEIWLKGKEYDAKNLESIGPIKLVPKGDSSYTDRSVAELFVAESEGPKERL